MHKQIINAIDKIVSNQRQILRQVVTVVNTQHSLQHCVQNVVYGDDYYYKDNFSDFSDFEDEYDDRVDDLNEISATEVAEKENLAQLCLCDRAPLHDCVRKWY